MANTSSDGGGGELHVVMFPWFAFGHISPFLQLARKLSSHGFRVSFLSAPANISRISSLLPPSSSIYLLPLRIPPVPGLPHSIESTAEMTPAMAELLKQALDLMKPQIQTLLSHLTPHLVFYDFAQPWLPSIASPLHIKTIFFSVFSAVSTAFLTVPSRRHPDSSTPGLEELRSPPDRYPDTSSIQSVPTYQAADFLYLFRSFSGKPSVYDRVVGCMEGCTAIVIKTCMEMEGKYINYVESQYRKPVLLAGPVVPESPSGELEERWAKWLDGFPEKSVIFCSFGSETFLNDGGIRELVLGLEMTGLPFFVVLNFPSSEGGEGTLRSKLPEGFEERVKGRGVVHSGWVQQQHILGHRSVGCFVCHAGLSSLMEGVVTGCQLVMLPQRGDQYLNARLFGGDLRAGVEVRREAEDGRFGRGDVCEAVRKLMVEELGRTVREEHGRWREFLMNKEVQEKFTEDFVDKLKELAAK